MNTATMIILFLMGLNLIINIVKDGQPQPNYNATGSFIGAGIALLLYHYAGLL